MLSKPRILSFFTTHVINSIKHEHSFKILFVCNFLKFLLDMFSTVSNVIDETGPFYVYIPELYPIYPNLNST